MTTTEKTIQCACPSRDEITCVEIRYNLSPSNARAEPCDCACHDEVGRRRPLFDEIEHVPPTEDDLQRLFRISGASDPGSSWSDRHLAREARTWIPRLVREIWYLRSHRNQ